MRKLALLVLIVLALAVVPLLTSAHPLPVFGDCTAQPGCGTIHVYGTNVCATGTNPALGTGHIRAGTGGVGASNSACPSGA